MHAGPLSEGRVGTVFVDGVFDLLHYGHLQFLVQARQFGARLLVGVHSDATVRQYKRQPVFPEHHRYALVESLRQVDQVIRDVPLLVTAEFIRHWGIDAVVHGNDHQYSEFYRVPLELGIMHYVPYTPEITTTSIIRRLEAGHGSDGAGDTEAQRRTIRP